MKKHFLYILVALALGCTSCDKNPYHKNVSNIQVEFQTIPFHSDVENVGMQNDENGFRELQEKYGAFLDTYITDVGRLTEIPENRTKLNILHTFIINKWIQELYHLSDSALQKNQPMLDKKITNALKYFKYYFPERNIPQFYTFITGVNYSMAIDSNVIAIGIDKYLGAKCDFYNSMSIESYIRRNMVPEKIPADLMRALAESEFPNAFDEDYLLATMIQHGRYQYFMKCMLPDEPDTLLWGFTAKQLDFCEKSEGEFWKYLISTENLLFSSDYMTQKRFVEDGPFTIVFTKDSPARVGQWIGFKIVESYMQNNPQTTLEELFSIRSSKEIMSKARYNPK
ncbi:MAG: hypothetical protein II926_10630 [Bacteroidales bacterium]|nr:hypothetical protein [Bacteroidales bacterium]